ncbi:hypothetical protein ACGFWI_24475 [Streptomyces sp. NPDC048434]|uniref:hypothetical protein n=1 Tax=Streptomyces sp. NPDC048434 TaxID=3365549 RepID=UPI00371DE834
MSKAEGAKALTHFTESFNKANRRLDPALNPSFEGGALLAIDQAGIKAAHALRPQGNPGFDALALTDPHFTVPKQAGWPKYFIADAASNRKNAGGRNTHWFLVFSRNGIDEQWRAVYLATFANNKAPELKTDGNGYAEAVPADAQSGVTVDPGKLSRTYADYLNTGKGSAFAPGPQTDGWRARRAKDASRPGQRIMWEDSAADYPPVALRTKDGGALVFFSTVYHQQQTLFAGASISVGRLKGLLEGPPKKTNRMLFTTVSGQTVKVPAKSSGGKVTVLNRIEAKTAVKPM